MSLKQMVTRPRTALDLVFLTVLAIFLVWGGLRIMPDKMFPDFISHWTAGELLASGQSPYSSESQARVHQEHGWDKATDGLGIYDFLPFYYPPWFGFLWVLAVPLGFASAKVGWFFINVELALLTGYMLKRALPGIPAWMPLTIVPCFLFTIATVLLGQTSILVFFLIVLGWRLLDTGHDRSAGVVLAWLTIKPQLTAVLLLALLIWLARQRRWAAMNSFLITMAVLILASTIIVPKWPLEMWAQMREIPMPTDYFPWIGNTWFLLLKTARLERAALWLLYLVLALPLLGCVLKTAYHRAAPLADVLAVSILAAFFVAPYARHYDFPVLLIPVLALLAKRPSALVLGLLMPALVLLPFFQLYLLMQFKAARDPNAKFLIECTYFWVPVVCLATWMLLMRRAPTTTPTITASTHQVA